MIGLGHGGGIIVLWRGRGIIVGGACTITKTTKTKMKMTMFKIDLPTSPYYSSVWNVSIKFGTWNNIENWLSWFLKSIQLSHIEHLFPQTILYPVSDIQDGVLLCKCHNLKKYTKLIKNENDFKIWKKWRDKKIRVPCRSLDCFSRSNKKRENQMNFRYYPLSSRWSHIHIYFQRTHH